VAGKLFDVVVDLRPESSTFLEWVGTWLPGSETKHVYVPSGCGHAIYADEDNTVMVYFKDQTYTPDAEKAWHWQSFGIEWPECDEYILSEKDKNAPEYEPPHPYYCVQHGGSPATERANEKHGFTCPRCEES
jgi:dTDP-4-dehydrorhamnose 3,5-epimerase